MAYYLLSWTGRLDIPSDLFLLWFIGYLFHVFVAKDAFSLSVWIRNSVSPKELLVLVWSYCHLRECIYGVFSMAN